MIPELSRPVSSEQPPAAVTVEATAEECAALAVRLNIVAVESLRCRFTLRARGKGVDAEGELDALVVQSCVVSLEPVAQGVHERFTVRFVPGAEVAGDDDPEAPDEILYSGAKIDLGDAAAEQLALALDPYPRHPDAVLDEAGGGESAEETGSPFGTLAALRKVPPTH